MQDSLPSQIQDILEKEKELHMMKLELTRLELEASFFDHIDSDKLLEKQSRIRKFTDNLTRINEIGTDEIIRRLEEPFAQGHIQLDHCLHKKMVDIVEGAFSDILNSREDVEIAKWCHTPLDPIPELVEI